jgi:hypothetical protein
VVPAKIRGRLREAQLHSKQSEGYDVDAIGEEQQAMEAQVQFGIRHSPLPSVAPSSSQP